MLLLEPGLPLPSQAGLSIIVNQNYDHMNDLSSLSDADLEALLKAQDLIQSQNPNLKALSPKL